MQSTYCETWKEELTDHAEKFSPTLKCYSSRACHLMMLRFTSIVQDLECFLEFPNLVWLGYYYFVLNKCWSLVDLRFLRRVTRHEFQFMFFGYRSRSYEPMFIETGYPGRCLGQGFLATALGFANVSWSRLFLGMRFSSMFSVFRGRLNKQYF